MSLFSAPSEILKLIQEFTLSGGEPEGELPTGDSAGISDVATELSSSNPTPPPTKAPGSPTMQVPSMTAQPMSSSAVTKTMIGADTVTGLLSGMKAAITDAEKKFQKGAVEPSVAAASLGVMFITLKNLSDELQKVCTPGQSTPEAAPEMPPPAPEMPMPDAGAELPPSEPLPAEPSSPAVATPQPNTGAM